MVESGDTRLGAWQLPQPFLIAVIALVQVGGTALAVRHQPERGPIGVVGFALLAGGVALLPLRFRRPDAVLAGVLALTLAYWALGYPRGPVFLALLVAFGHAVNIGHRRAAIGSLVAGFIGFPWLGWLIGREPMPALGSVVALAAWLVSLLSVAELVRGRRLRAREAAELEAEALRRQAADERMRIARDLHDAVAHNMSLINIQASVALHLMDQRPEQAGDALAVIKRASKEALVELRSILGVLRAVDEDAPRAPTPTLSRIDDLVAHAALSGVDVDLDVECDLDDVPVAVSVAAYRIVQESLTNVARHAEPPAATVRVRAANGSIRVEVLDEGTGRAGRMELPSGGNGIAGMRERAAAVGGHLEAGPRPGRGFAVRAELPLEEAHS